MRSRPLLILPLLTLCLLGCASEEHSAQRPNVFLIVAGDLGYANIDTYNDDTFYGMPHINSLVRRGMV